MTSPTRDSSRAINLKQDMFEQIQKKKDVSSLTRTVRHSTQVYKWVTTNLMVGGIPAMYWF